MNSQPDTLAELAHAHGILTEWVDGRGQRHTVSPNTLVALLEAMDVDASTPDAIRQALALHDLAEWRQLSPPSAVCRIGEPETFAIRLHMESGAGVEAHITNADGVTRPAAALSDVAATREVDGVTRHQRRLELPASLDVGVHQLTVTTRGSLKNEESVTTVVVCPQTVPSVVATGPLWGWELQPYALRSAGSWEIADFTDLQQLAIASTDWGAGFVVSGPWYAAVPVAPREVNGQLPATRRFVDPLFIRVEDVPEFDDAPGMVVRRVERLAETARAHNRDSRIDSDRAWRTKLDALTLLHSVPMSRERAHQFAEWRTERGQPLEDFATYCAIAEEHGADWRRWPNPLRRPHGRGVASARQRLRQRVAFHIWLQWCAHEQLAGVQKEAARAGMPVGLVADLPAGVLPGSADAWALQLDVRSRVTIGSPPDDTHPDGVDFELAPLDPVRLAETGYAPWRDILRSTLAYAGGVRLNRVSTLFTQWWIPQGAAPSDGAFVRQPTQDLLAVLAAEAHSAGAVVIGADDGPTIPEVAAALEHTGIATNPVVLDARAEPPEQPELPLAGDTSDQGRRWTAWEYPALALTSVSGPSGPTAAAWWSDEEIDLWQRLRLMDAGEADAARQRKADERPQLREQLVAAGVLAPTDTDDPDTLTAATLRFLLHTPSALIAVSPADALGDRQQPATGSGDYPDWALPVAEPAPEGPRPILLEKFLEHPQVLELLDLLAVERPTPP